MADDALRTLLRGCKGASVAKWHAKPRAAAPAAPPPLPSALDFFGNGASRAPPRSTAPSARAAPASPAPASPADLAALSEAVDDAVLERALRRIGITAPTAVQRRAIPPMRAGRDVVAIAPTGSGKTLAYALPLLRALRAGPRPPHPNAPRALVLAPTRELAAQIGRVFARLVAESRLGLRLKVVASKAALAGLKAAKDAGSVDVVVATPMRLVTAADGGALALGHVAHVVLDEADELFDNKFVAQVDGVLAACGQQRKDGARVHMFSATLPAHVELLTQSLLRNPRKVVVSGGAYGGAAAVGGVAEAIKQTFTFVGGRGEQGKVFAVRALLKGTLKPPALVFVQSKDRAAELFRELVYDGVNVDAIHADRSQAARDSAVARFRSGEVWVLIATDVLARGLDFLCVNSVVNYDMPASATAYVHRIGRTGRNGRSGQAVTLFTEEDRALLAPILKVAKASGAEVPEWALKVKAERKDVVRRLEKRPPKRRRVGGPNMASLPKRHRKEMSIGRRRDDGEELREAGGEDAERDGGKGESGGSGQRKRKSGRRRSAKAGGGGSGGGAVELFDDGDDDADRDA